jgi:hypothetical protein
MKGISAKLIAIATVLFAVTAVSAKAGVIYLTFDNVSPYPFDDNILILNYFNGGTSSIGTNYGISFPDNGRLACLNTPGVICSNSSKRGQGNPNSQLATVTFVVGSSILVNDPAGFTTASRSPTQPSTSLVPSRFTAA